jgi:hypothetical protein
MIRGLGTVLCLDLFSNFKWVRSRDYLSESLGLMHSPSGPFLVSRTGDEG